MPEVTTNLFIDFDGTIVDIWKRYYSIYMHFLLKYDKSVRLSEDSFKNLKKKYINDEIVFKKIGFIFNQTEISIWKKYKSKRLERDKILLLDKEIGDFSSFSKTLKKRDFNIFLLTLRSKQQSLFLQLDRLKLTQFFDKIFVLHPDRLLNPKIRIIKENLNTHNVIIGDSYVDMEAGQANAIESYFVNTGLFNYDAILQINKKAIPIESYEKYLSI